MKIKLEQHEIEQRIGQGEIHAEIDKAGVITITTFVPIKGWAPVNRAAHAHVLSRIASGAYTLQVAGRGVYEVKRA